MSEYNNRQVFGSHVDHDCDEVKLSETGRNRRDALLEELQSEVINEGRLRRLRRRIVRSVSLAVIIIVVSISLVTPWPTSDNPVAVTINAEPKPSLQIQIVEANTEAVAAMIVSPTANIDNYYIDDRRLTDMLSEIGRPSGLIRTGSTVCLVVPVTDPISLKP